MNKNDVLCEFPNPLIRTGPAWQLRPNPLIWEEACVQQWAIHDKMMIVMNNNEKHEAILEFQLNGRIY